MSSLRKAIRRLGPRLSRAVEWLLDRVLLAHFLLRGKRPFSRGYDVYKWRQIAESLRAPVPSIETLPAGYGLNLDERIVEYPWLLARLPVGESGRLLDAGSVLNFDAILSHPALGNKKVVIVTLAPESHAFWERGVSYLYDDLRSLPFADGVFDWIVCLSTLEHIGLDNTTYFTDDPANRESCPDDYVKVVSECRRLLKPGGTLFLSVPFGARENHGWLQVFDSAMLDRAVAAFGHDLLSKVFFRYAPGRGWRVADEAACADAIYYDFHQSGLAADQPAAAEAVACVELRKNR